MLNTVRKSLSILVNSIEKKIYYDFKNIFSRVSNIFSQMEYFIKLEIKMCQYPAKTW